MNNTVLSAKVCDNPTEPQKVIREPFDYTKWQKDLFSGMSIEEISSNAVRYCEENPR